MIRATVSDEISVLRVSVSSRSSELILFGRMTQLFSFTANVAEEVSNTLWREESVSSFWGFRPVSDMSQAVKLPNP